MGGWENGTGSGVLLGAMRMSGGSRCSSFIEYAVAARLQSGPPVDRLLSAWLWRPCRLTRVRGFAPLPPARATTLSLRLNNLKKHMSGHLLQDIVLIYLMTHSGGERLRPPSSRGPLPPFDPTFGISYRHDITSSVRYIKKPSPSCCNVFFFFPPKNSPPQAFLNN